MSITKRTVTEHINALKKKEYSAKELCRAYLEKIEKENPLYNAYISTDYDLSQKEAEYADLLFAKGPTHPLCGLPYAAKDNICTKGRPTTAGSAILSDFSPPYSATVIERLKSKGSVLLGKTNMDEFAMGSSTETSVFGPALNPTDLTLSPGGSSGGSAAAVSAGLAPFALGSDTGGSVRCPAAFCGCVGLCPTYGAVSRYGLIAFASSLDRIGIITANCADAAQVFLAISGKDKMDATTKDSVFPPVAKPKRGLRIGLIRELLDVASPVVRRAVELGAKRLSEIGYEIVPVSLPSLNLATEAYYIISSAEASSNLARYDGVRFGKRSSTASSLEEFYQNNRNCGFGDEVKRRIMLGTFVLSEGQLESYYKKALSAKELLALDYARAFEMCDLILSPTSPSLPFPSGMKRPDPTEIYKEDICTVSQSLVGLPALSVPCKAGERGLFAGLQLTGPKFSESLLLAVGQELEEVSK